MFSIRATSSKAANAETEPAVRTLSTDRALHIDQGIAVTSHASQGKTVDQVIASAPVSSFAQVN
ncbi:MAG: hypothetical protein JO251_07940 [Verrucomicrobia bacterium]|nr:hypothetical protein [Verrucomicrobiota bacterium]